MDQTPQLAAQITPWLTLIVLFPTICLTWRSTLHLEGRLGKRIDDTSNRIDDTSGALGARIGRIDNRMWALENG